MNQKKNLAFVDLETTGVDPESAEIIEIAVIHTTSTFVVSQELTFKVLPKHIETASAEALAINGYNQEDWKDAKPLREVLQLVAPLLQGATIAGHNVEFDRSFLVKAFKAENLPWPDMAYHRFDTASLARPLLVADQIKAVSLSNLVAYFGIEQGTPHRALSDVRCTLEVARKLTDMMTAPKLTDANLAKEVISRLNTLIARPAIRKDIETLLNVRVQASPETCEHPTIQVHHDMLGFMGLLNGIIGVDNEGDGLVSAHSVHLSGELSFFAENKTPSQYSQSTN